MGIEKNFIKLRGRLQILDSVIATGVLTTSLSKTVVLDSVIAIVVLLLLDKKFFSGLLLMINVSI